MNRRVVLKCVQLIMVFLVHSQLYAQPKPAPKWLEKAVFYQIYPQSFKDTDGDGIGDVKGIIEKLDYVQSLGCNALWLNPCFESAFKDAGYDVIDYYKVAPRYGTNNDLKKLFQEAHKRGIKVCLDLVAGHTSDQHPWFKKSTKKEGVYTDRYIWTPTLKDENSAYVKATGERKEYFMKNFFDCQPALNYGFATIENPWEQPVNSTAAQNSRKELFAIMDYWMTLGADGFRVDMASSLIKRDVDFVETGKLWAEIRGKFQDKYPEGVLISEWGNPEQAIKAGFMIDFMIHFGVKGFPSLFFNEEGVFHRKDCYFSAEGNGSPIEFVENYLHQINAVGNNGFVSVPTANHDIQRPHAGNRNSQEQLKVVMTFLLTLKGIPFIYYGDEIGMPFISNLPDKEGSLLVGMNDIYGNPLGNRAGTRTPMQWNNDPNAGFSNAKPNQLYLPIDKKASHINVAEQIVQPNSLFNFTKSLIQLRKKHEALGNMGEIEFVYAKENTYPLVYTRSFGKDKFLVVVNPSKNKSSATIPLSTTVKPTPIIKEKVQIKKQENNLTIVCDGFSYAIYKL